MTVIVKDKSRIIVGASLAVIVAALTFMYMIVTAPAVHADWAAGTGTAWSGANTGTGMSEGIVWWYDSDPNSDIAVNESDYAPARRAVKTKIMTAYRLTKNVDVDNIHTGVMSVVEPTLREAIQNCKDRHGGRCDSPYVAAVGWSTVRDCTPPRNGYGPGSGFANCLGPSNSGELTNAAALANKPLNIGGNSFSSNQSLFGGKSVYSLAADGLRKGVRLRIVVLAKQDYEQKGWYPVYQPHKRVDVASANKISSHKFAPCAAYYYMTATGIDGYVRGMATKTTKYQTPYGKLYDAVQTGGTWKSASGKTYGPFTGNWAMDDAKLRELEEARNVSCDETQRMTIKYNFGDAVAGSSDKGFDGTDKSDEKKGGDGVVITLKGSDFDSKEDFLKAYAKGGIYKVVKAKKEATITGKTADVKYFYRKSNWFEFVGWRECKKGDVISQDMMGLGGWSVNPDVINHWSNNNDNKCGYIGMSKPIYAPKHAGSLDMRDDYNNSNTHAVVDGRDHGFYGGDPYSNGYYETSAKWIEANDQESNDIKSLKDVMYLGGERRELTAVFNRGYATKFRCGGVEVTAGQVGQSQDMNTQKNCEAVDWAFQNDILGIWQAETVNGKNTGKLVLKWFPGGKEAFQNGMPLRGAAESTLNSQLHPVSNRFQSVVTMAYQDFVNMNCNKTDFEAYVNTVRAQQSTLGLDGGMILQVDMDTKFNQTAHTGVITRDDANRLGWKTLAEITPRVMSSTHINGSTWVNGLKAEDVMGPDGKADGQNAATYASTSGKYWVGYNADLDPVYSKECPFDCTSEKGATGNRTVDTANVTDKDNNPNAEDVAKGATGVKVKATDAKGNIVTDDDKAKNTANMVFFRNGEYNNFVVDVYAPVTGGNNAGQVSYDGKPAKSTIVTRDPKGTTWFAKDSGTQLTFMQAKQGDSYRDIFTGNDNGEKDYENQLQSKTANGSTKGISVVLTGQVNDFNIKSTWATESGLPLKFQAKWEYNADVHVSIPDSVSFTGSGTPNGNHGAGATWKTVATTVDGKCLSQQNTHTPSPDTTKLNHDSSGSGRVDVDDRTFRKDEEFGIPQRGWFQVTFVRATAE